MQDLLKKSLALSRMRYKLHDKKNRINESMQTEKGKFCPKKLLHVGSVLHE